MVDFTQWEESWEAQYPDCGLLFTVLGVAIVAAILTTIFLAVRKDGYLLSLSNWDDFIDIISILSRLVIMVCLVILPIKLIIYKPTAAKPLQLKAEIARVWGLDRMRCEDDGYSNSDTGRYTTLETRESLPSENDTTVCTVRVSGEKDTFRVTVRVQGNKLGLYKDDGTALPSAKQYE